MPIRIRLVIKCPGIGLLLCQPSRRTWVDELPVLRQGSSTTWEIRVRRAQLLKRPYTMYGAI